MRICEDKSKHLAEILDLSKERGHLADIANDDYLDHFEKWCV